MRLARQVFPKNSVERKEAMWFAVRLCRYLNRGKVKDLIGLRAPVPHHWWAPTEIRQQYYDTVAEIIETLPDWRFAWLSRRKCFFCGSEHTYYAIVNLPDDTVPFVLCYRCLADRFKDALT